jgi:hypothetical protein
MMQIINERNAIIQELNRNGYKAVQLDIGGFGIIARAIDDEEQRDSYALIMWEKGWIIRTAGTSQLVDPATILRHCAAALETRTT